jgi:DNA polymerase-3 subunit delta'
MSWSRVRGHEQLIESFRRAVVRGRLAHAYLFVGPPGIGKRLFADELAKAILCEAPPPGQVLGACDRCESCVLAAAGTHPDLFLVRRPDERNELPIALMQELCGNFALKTARGRGKVAVLDDADDLNDESANCFLKTLEEPPASSVFILIGSSAEQQLPTIRSRCQVVRFVPLPAPTVRQVLSAADISDPVKLDRLTQLASGSPGQALALADDSLWTFRGEFLEGLACRKPDSIELGRRFVEFAEEAGKESALQRRRAALALKLLGEALADTLNLQFGASARSAGPEAEPLLRALAARAGPEKILAMAERSLDAEVQLNRYVHLALVLEGLVDGLVQTLA